MKKIIIALAAIAAVFTMVSCSKDQPAPTEGNGITASTENILTKTSLSGNDTDGYKVYWSEGDNLFVDDYCLFAHLSAINLQLVYLLQRYTDNVIIS